MPWIWFMTIFARDIHHNSYIVFIAEKYPKQCLSQDLETGCLKLVIVKILGVQIFKEGHNILRFQP